MSDWTVVRRGRAGYDGDDASAAPISPVVGSGGGLDGDMERGLGCSLALFVPRRWRLLTRRRTRWACEAK